ncbi:SRPBCC family protein [Streptomyces beigongshangae]|uniref:SRPBCC family protein n=1 Tax=Streptomyces beigongshangae TaxID=2841597 RepID=UPI001C848105|nr:SRPBCC family protein [Streptomyces sp. REN17]
MYTVEETIEVAVPVRTAYNQWTQFKGFPGFMTVVKKVVQVRPALLTWTLGFGPVHREFQIEIVEQEPDSHLTWQGLGRRPVHRGEVSFRPGTAGGTAVTVRIEIGSRGATGVFGGLPRLAGRVVRTELTHFKEYVEGLGAESGAWRGVIRDGRVRPREPKPDRSRAAHWPVG